MIDVNGWCRLCGLYFVGMDEDEYRRAAAGHIVDNHRTADPDLVIVRTIEPERRAV